MFFAGFSYTELMDTPLFLFHLDLKGSIMGFIFFLFWSKDCSGFRRQHYCLFLLAYCFLFLRNAFLWVFFWVHFSSFPRLLMHVPFSSFFFIKTNIEGQCTYYKIICQLEQKNHAKNSHLQELRRAEATNPHETPFCRCLPHS